MDIDKDLASILIRKQNAGTGARVSRQIIRSREAPALTASQLVVQLKLLLTSSYVDM